VCTPHTINITKKKQALESAAKDASSKMEAVETQKKQLEDQNTALSVKISELERAIRSERNLKDKVYPQRYTTIGYIRSVIAIVMDYR
jgi:septal ring factor EnvC (AmiA/AmiB activator)